MRRGRRPRGPAPPPPRRPPPRAPTQIPAVTAAAFSWSVPATAAASAGAPGPAPGSPIAPRRRRRASTTGRPARRDRPRSGSRRRGTATGTPRAAGAPGRRAGRGPAARSARPRLPAGGEGSPHVDRRRAVGVHETRCTENSPPMLSGRAGVIVTLHSPWVDVNSRSPSGPWIVSESPAADVSTGSRTTSRTAAGAGRSPNLIPSDVSIGGGSGLADLAVSDRGGNPPGSEGRRHRPPPRGWGEGTGGRPRDAHPVSGAGGAARRRERRGTVEPTSRASRRPCDTMRLTPTAGPGSPALVWPASRPAIDARGDRVPR